MAKFVYNNIKNASTGHTSFELNYGYHPRMLYKKEVDSRSKFKSADKLPAELKELMIVCQKNLHHIQNFKSKPTRKVFSLKALSPIIKYG